METRAYQAETKQLLDLMIHSLYTDKEIFLRELISNASDALDRLRFESLTNADLLQDGDKFEIRIDTDAAARTLTISDTGIGMSREEVIANIGTIAKSGTAELRRKVMEARTEGDRMSLIGQFGVGFYSAFMVADKVTLATRRAGETQSTVWESSGDGTYTIDTGDKESRGTAITLHLKKVDEDAGIEDFCDPWRISSIVKRHSDFISYPVIVKRQKEEGEGENKVITLEDQVLNSQKPIWTRSQGEVTEEEYAEFYKHLSHDWEGPLKTIPLKAEGVQEYRALLFVPSRAPYDLFYHGSEWGLRLLAKSVVVIERCGDLLPRYLRFVRGAVDSADLPLNISRQRLQQDRHISQMRKWLAKKILDSLGALAKDDATLYLKFWKEFGAALKEGVTDDFDNREKLLPLLLFASSNDGEKLTSLREYCERMKPGQDQIFYLTGESRAAVEHSPHLESVRDRGYEVLYLTDPVDELLVQSLTEFEGKKLKSVGKGTVSLDTAEEREKTEKELAEKQTAYSGLLEVMQKSLAEYVKTVRLTQRLKESAACLVVEEHEYSPNLERLLGKAKGMAAKQKRILELNPQHPIVTGLWERFQKDPADPQIGEQAELLLGAASLAEGSDLPNRERFGGLLYSVMEKVLGAPR